MRELFKKLKPKRYLKSASDNTHYVGNMHRLKEKFDEGILAIESSQLFKQSNKTKARYAIPWFIIIGPSKHGKTTLLQHTNLHISLNSNNPFETTNDFKWWFTDKGVLLDTDGMYTNNNNDRNAWIGFLNCLKRYRPKQPVDGIIVVIRLDEVFATCEKDLAQLANTLRLQINDIVTYLKKPFPLHIILTHFDLLPGFETFFATFNKTQCAQAFGIDLMNITLNIQKKPEAYKQLDILVEHMFSLRLPLTDQSTPSDQKLSYLAFPDAFKKTVKQVKLFIHLLFKENPYQKTPNFIGLYFTGIIKTEKQSSKGFFIHTLLTKIIFQQAKLFQKTYRDRFIHKQLKKPALILSMTSLFLCSIIFYHAYAYNWIIVKHTIAIQNAAFTTTDDEQTLNKQKIVISNLYLTYQNLIHSSKQIPFYDRLGYFQANRLYPNIKTVLLKSIRDQIIQPSIENLAHLLKILPSSYLNTAITNINTLQNNNYVFLETYLSLCESKHREDDLNAAVLSHLAPKTLEIPNHLKYAMIAFYLENNGYPIWTEDPTLTQQARQALSSSMKISYLYTTLKIKGINKLGECLIDDFLSKDNAHVFYNQKTLSIFFTQKGYNNYVKPEIQAIANTSSHYDWVLNTPVNYQNHLITQLNDLYFHDYIQAWRKFLNSINIHCFYSFDDAENTLTRLSDINGPLNQFIQQANENMRFAQSGNDSLSKPSLDLSTYLKQIDRLNQTMRNFSASPDVSRDVESYVKQLLSGKADQLSLYQASITASQIADITYTPALKQSMQHVLLSPVIACWQFLLSLAQPNITQSWQTYVYAYYQQSLAHQFPFLASAEDANIEDLNHFFHPREGVFWQFFQQSLSPYLIETEQGWRTQTWLGVGMNFSAPFLNALYNIKALSQSLYDGTRALPSFTFDVYPIPTPGIQEISLVTNGQSMHYHNEPQEWQHIHWPGNTTDSEASISIVTAKNHLEGNIAAEGPWGFFKLLQRASLHQEDENTIRANWQITLDNHQSFPVSFLIRTEHHNSFFNAHFFNHFNLPNDLFITNNERHLPCGTNLVDTPAIF